MADKYDLNLPLKTLHNTMRDKNFKAVSYIHLETIVDCVNVCNGRPELVGELLRAVKDVTETGQPMSSNERDNLIRLVLEIGGE